MAQRYASCSCGKLTVRTFGDPVRISVCHCLACQKRTGSVFGAQARFPAPAVEVRGDSSQFTRIADSGKRITFHFCPTCGSTVYYRLEVDPEVVAVPIGAFADPSFPAPRFSVYESRRHAWVRLPEAIEQSERAEERIASA